MKLILAIVNNDDSMRVSAALTEAGFGVTRLSTSGGFLMVGNTTFLIGTEDDRKQQAIDIIKEYCPTRKQFKAPRSSRARGLGQINMPEEVKVGGATIFVMEVEHMEKI